MKKPTLEQIISVMKKKGMVVFTKPYDMTFGGVRTNDNALNKFNDFIFMLYYDDKGKLQGIVETGTTDAGLTYRKKPMNKNGTAIIQHEKQYRGVYQYQNPPVNNPELKKQKKPLQLGHNGKEAFRQMKPMDYWRDANKDGVLDFEGKTYTEIASTNVHDMGTLGNNVDNWSAGCVGTTEKQMDKFYDLAKLQIKHGHGDYFSFAMLHEQSF